MRLFPDRLRRASFSLGVLLLLGGLSGCATTGDYGNFLDNKHAAAQTQLAKESAGQLQSLYPPAKTHLTLQQDTPDAFGGALVGALREAGFAVQTFDKGSPRGHTAPRLAETLLPDSPNEPVTIALAYVLDQAGEAGLYHLTLYLDRKALTRPYRMDNDRFEAVGLWVYRKE